MTQMSMPSLHTHEMPWHNHHHVVFYISIVAIVMTSGSNPELYLLELLEMKYHQVHSENI
jgi:hypothetical protein